MEICNKNRFPSGSHQIIRGLSLELLGLKLTEVSVYSEPLKANCSTLRDVILFVNKRRDNVDVLIRKQCYNLILMMFVFLFLFL